MMMIWTGRNQIVFTIILFFSLTVSSTSQLFNWEKEYGGDTTMMGFDIIETFDNNYVVVGYYGPSKKSYILKMNSIGDTLWMKVFNTPLNSEAIGVVETEDYGYLIVSNFFNYQLNIDNVLLTKTNMNGDTIWNRTYTADLECFARNVTKTNLNSFLITGFCIENDTAKSWLLSIDSLGNRIWEKTFKRGVNSRIDDAIQIIPNYYLFIGEYSETFFESTVSSLWVAKIDNFGNILIEKTYQRFPNQFPQKIINTSDGKFIAITNKANLPSEDDIWLIKLDEMCDTIWTKEFPTEHRTIGLSIKENTDGTLFSIGYQHPPNSYSARDVLLIKYSSNGEILWQQLYGTGFQESGNEIVLSNNKIVILANRYNSSTWNHNLWIFEVYDNTSSVSSVKSEFNFHLYNNYPNPFNPSTVIQFELNQFSNFKLIIFDALGKVVKTWEGEKPEGLYSFQWDGKDKNQLDIVSGVYFYQLIVSNSIQTKKLMLIR